MEIDGEDLILKKYVKSAMPDFRERTNLWIIFVTRTPSTRKIGNPNLSFFLTYNKKCKTYNKQQNEQLQWFLPFYSTKWANL